MRFFGKSHRTPNIGPRLPILTFAGVVGTMLGVWVETCRCDSSDHAPVTQSPLRTGNHAPQSGYPSSGQELLEHAILVLESRPSVSARIRHSVDLFGHRPVGSGLYLEQRSEHGPLFRPFRLELRMQLGGEPSSVLHVCDGRYLWIYRKLGDGHSLGRIDVHRVAQALEESGDIGQVVGVGEWPGLGGLPRLLRGLHAAFDFPTVEETYLAGHLPVWRLRGRWKPERLAELLPGQKGAIEAGKTADLRELPPHLPDHVLLFLGRLDEFPCRIEYRRDPGAGKGREASGGRSLVTMELFQVNLNAPIHPTRFIYSPGDLEFSDRTSQFLRDLGLAR